MSPRTRAVRRHAMTAGSYEIVAGIIRKIEDPEMRQRVADHFATEFNRRSPSFDAMTWNKATGGRPAANSAMMGGARKPKGDDNA